MNESRQDQPVSQDLLPVPPTPQAAARMAFDWLDKHPTIPLTDSRPYRAALFAVGCEPVENSRFYAEAVSELVSLRRSLQEKPAQPEGDKSNSVRVTMVNDAAPESFEVKGTELCGNYFLFTFHDGRRWLVPSSSVLRISFPPNVSLPDGL